MNKKKLYKVEDGKKVAGVCGGLAEYLGMDPTIIRLIWALCFFLGGTGLLLYIVAALVIPNKSDIVE